VATSTTFEVLEVTGGSGDDSFYGSSGNETFAGGGGNDTLSGNAAMTLFCSDRGRARSHLELRRHDRRSGHHRPRGVFASFEDVMAATNRWETTSSSP
jgi:hypothetical protein